MNVLYSVNIVTSTSDLLGFALFPEVRATLENPFLSLLIVLIYLLDVPFTPWIR